MLHGYGALVVGHPIDLNAASRELWEYIPDDLSQCIEKESGLRLYGGTRYPEDAPFEPAFLGRSVAYLREESERMQTTAISAKRREEMLAWLSQGFANVDQAQAYLDEWYPGVEISPLRE